MQKKCIIIQNLARFNLESELRNAHEEHGLHTRCFTLRYDWTFERWCDVHRMTPSLATHSFTGSHVFMEELTKLDMRCPTGQFTLYAFLMFRENKTEITILENQKHRPYTHQCSKERLLWVCSFKKEKKSAHIHICLTDYQV